ncbi:MAG: signal peptidase II [bacterium]
MPVLIVICVITFLDQLTKALISRHLSHHDTMSVISGFFNLAHVHNTGAAFSMFHGSNMPLAIFSAVILTAMIIFRKRFFSGSLAQRLAIAMVTAGIIGNLMDRVKFASVVDIFDFYFGNYHFPTFNIADSSICIGVTIYVICNFFEYHSNAAVVTDRRAGAAKETAAPQAGAEQPCCPDQRTGDEQ